MLVCLVEVVNPVCWFGKEFYCVHVVYVHFRERAHAGTIMCPRLSLWTKGLLNGG